MDYERLIFWFEVSKVAWEVCQHAWDTQRQHRITERRDSVVDSFTLPCIVRGKCQAFRMQVVFSRTNIPFEYF